MSNAHCKHFLLENDHSLITVWNKGMVYSDFGLRLKKAIEDAGLWGSRREMAKTFKVSPGTMSNLFTGARLPSHKLAVKLAVRLNVSVDWLMTGRETPESLDQRLDRLPPEARQFFIDTLMALESKYSR